MIWFAHAFIFEFSRVECAPRSFAVGVRFSTLVPALPLTLTCALQLSLICQGPLKPAIEAQQTMEVHKEALSDFEQFRKLVINTFNFDSDEARYLACFTCSDSRLQFARSSIRARRTKRRSTRTTSSSTCSARRTAPCSSTVRESALYALRAC